VAVSAPPAEAPLDTARVVPGLARRAGESKVEYAARMKTLGDDAFERARTFDAVGRTGDAVAQYERAVQLLAPDDPNRKAAKRRLDALRAGIVK
jgi:hypothetical protein